MIPQLSYFMGFILGFFLTYLVLRAIKIERAFPQGKIFEIRIAYIIISLVIGHFIGHMIYFIVTLF